MTDFVTDKPISVRRATQEDLRFICASWFESNWKSLCHLGAQPLFEDYKPAMDRRIKSILTRAVAAVAYATNVPDEIVGYAISEKNILHFVYVKSVYRRQGIASALVGQDKKYYTHYPSKTGALFFPHFSHMHYNPFILDRP